MSIRKSVLAATFALSALAAGAAGAAQISPEAAVDLLSSQDSAPPVVLDLRSTAAYEAGHLPGALNVDASDPYFGPFLDSLERDKAYLLYDGGGSKSAEVEATMNSLGFPTVYTLSGGMPAWQSANLPLGE